ncbi:MAG: SRPBCC family protein [Longimicrobiales bacterium]
MDGTLERDGARYTLRVEHRLAKPPEKVWRALTTRELMKRWFPCDVEGEWTVGAVLQFEFLQGEGEGLSDADMRGEVLAVEEPRLLEFRWGTDVLKFELTPDGDGCRFHLSHSFDDPSFGARNAAGWEICLENLDLVLEGVGFAKFVAKVWKAKFDRYVGEFEAVHGPQAGPPENDPLLAENADSTS